MLTMRTTGTCTAVNGKTVTAAFKDLQVGDKIEFSCPIKRAGYHSSSGTKASYIRCVNVQTGAISKLSFNQLANVLDKFTITDNSNVR